MSREIKNSTIHFNEDEKSLRNTDVGKIIFTKYNGLQLGMYIKNNRLLQASVCDDSLLNVDDLYIARVSNVSKNISAYFVNVSKSTACFLSFKNATNPIILNRNYDGRILQGDLIIVKVIKTASKLKQASVSCDVNLSQEDIQAFQHKALYTKLRTGKNSLLTFIQTILQSTSQLLDNNLEIITDLDNVYEDLSVSLENDMLPANEKEHIILKRYNDSLSLNSLYSINTKMDTAIQKRIWLKSGGFLIIEHTEALTVIDVNSGKNESKKENEKYILDLNLEAAEELMLQICLRNISGIIIVDFINMKADENNNALLAYLKELAKKDSITTRIIDMTPLGLVEITRKKISAPLYEQLGLTKVRNKQS